VNVSGDAENVSGGAENASGGAENVSGGAENGTVRAGNDCVEAQIGSACADGGRTATGIWTVRAGNVPSDGGDGRCEDENGSVCRVNVIQRR
jgi:hypothetical protein